MKLLSRLLCALPGLMAQAPASPDEPAHWSTHAQGGVPEVAAESPWNRPVGSRWHASSGPA